MSTWTLQTIYSSEEDFEFDVSEVKRLLENLQCTPKSILNLQEAGKILKELDSYVECLIAQNPTDPKAHVKNGEIAELLSSYEAALFLLEANWLKWRTLHSKI